MTGLDTNGRRWQAWLNLDNAAALPVEDPEDVDDVSLWVTTPEFDEALRRKRAELDAEVPADADADARRWLRPWAAKRRLPPTRALSLLPGAGRTQHVRAGHQSR